MLQCHGSQSVPLQECPQLVQAQPTSLEQNHPPGQSQSSGALCFWCFVSHHGLEDGEDPAQDCNGHGSLITYNLNRISWGKGAECHCVLWWLH